MPNLTIFRYAIMRSIKSPMTIILNSLVPLVLTIFENHLTAPMIAGRTHFLIAFTVLFGAFLMAGSIQKDKTDGVVIRILAGPVTLRSYLVQNFLAAIVPMIVVSATVGILGVAIHSWDVTVAVGLVLVLILLSATSIGISFAWSCIFKDKEASMSGISLLLTLSAMLGGLMMPLEFLPDALFYLGAITPAHWAARSLQELMNYSSLTNMYWLGLLAMAMFATAFVLYGSKRRLV